MTYSNTLTSEQIEELRLQDLYPPEISTTDPQVINQKNIKLWIKLKKSLTQSGQLPDLIDNLNTAKTNFTSDQIDDVEFEYEVMKVAKAWYDFTKQKFDDNDWDFFVALNE